MKRQKDDNIENPKYTLLLEITIMKIIFNGEYKSLRTFESEELENFTVITGKNGSGKSQLLRILDEVYNGKQMDGCSLILEPGVIGLQCDDIEKRGSAYYSYESWKGAVSNYIFEFSNIPTHTRLLVKAIIENEIDLEQYYPIGFEGGEIEKSQFYNDLIWNAMQELEPSLFSIPRSQAEINLRIYGHKLLLSGLI